MIALVLLGVGVKKGVDYMALREMNMQAAHSSPLYEEPGTSGVNPMYDQH